MLLLALLAADPVTGPIKTFGDWAVACDNVHQCEMTSLLPGDGMSVEGSGYDEISLSIARGPGPAGAFTVEVSINTQTKGAAALRIDGQTVANGVPANDTLRFVGADADRIVGAIGKGKEVALTGPGRNRIGRVSLAGSSAALRFIDAEQGRVGTVSAAIAKGSKPATAVPMVLPAPVVRFFKPSGTAVRVTPALKTAMVTASDCGEEYEREVPKVEAYALGGGKTLALLPCGAGAYNYMSVPFVLAAGRPVFATFDSQPGMSEAGAKMPMLVNASWDPKTARLSSYSKGRGLGDCGSAEVYVWDGARFRLVEQRVMGECRGSVNWLTVWKAQAVAR
ncbi:DUF1176 domain-containing protein [Sphingomonas sp. JC676]|uniref:DUF1176 domain-containing protein n=1 Tax=Sphingomonas sp. JC676 TaxID=2768065 RepID=UPI0016582794|nr:DUF1176 domain-containing protein [Sphingomonas sp. JC676]MBC9034238.1 DUF1176 domain-containing protein [Sphingomonas sp. JC676]